MLLCTACWCCTVLQAGQFIKHTLVEAGTTYPRLGLWVQGVPDPSLQEQVRTDSDQFSGLREASSQLCEQQWQISPNGDAVGSSSSSWLRSSSWPAQSCQQSGPSSPIEQGAPSPCSSAAPVYITCMHGVVCRGSPNCAQVERMLPLCEAVYVIKRFVETRSQIEHPMVMQVRRDPCVWGGLAGVVHVQP